MYTLILTKRYIKQVRKIAKQGRDLRSLAQIISFLESGAKIPDKYKDHQLKGDMAMYRECHVKNDLLLVYFKNESELVLILIAVGTHSNLFGN